MMGRRPGPGDDYEEWEYPDQKDIDELANLPLYGEPSSSRRRLGPVVLKVVGAIMLVSFVGSLLLPLLGLLGGGGSHGVTSSGNTTQELQGYQQWIGSIVSAALNESGAAGQVQYVGVQFGDSIQDPTIGILVDGIDPRSSSGKRTLESHSISVLQRLFADERAQSVTLAWLGPAPDNESNQSLREVVLMVGMLRHTAQGINWPYIRAADLRELADYYQEPLPAEQESLSGAGPLERL